MAQVNMTPVIIVMGGFTLINLMINLAWRAQRPLNQRRFTSQINELLKIMAEIRDRHKILAEKIEAIFNEIVRDDPPNWLPPDNESAEIPKDLPGAFKPTPHTRKQF